MREIIFKARRLDNGEWVFGDLNHFSDGRAAIADSEQDWFLVDPETVCEYASIKDKTGERIFEGDILSAAFDAKHPEDETLSYVAWINYRWCTVQEGYMPDEISNFDEGIWKIVGNIHDSKVVKTDAQADSV